MNSDTITTNAEVTVVTGVGGMALACARRLAPGRRLVLASRTASRLESAAEVLRSEGYDVHEIVTDVSDPDAVRELAKRAGDLGRVRSVVHTAGVSPVQAPVDQIVAVDVMGTAYLLDAFLEYATPGMVVVCVSSSSAAMAQFPPPELERALAMTPTGRLAELPVFTDPSLTGGAAYAIAKRSNQVRVQAASMPYGRKGARVVSISPGIICTRMGQSELQGASGERIRSMVTASGTGRLGTSEDIASVGRGASCRS
jgi:NAD(P)-dependent dehydrogenase (short-subunit alcohol dehydrogenase family)